MSEGLDYRGYLSPPHSNPTNSKAMRACTGSVAYVCVSLQGPGGLARARSGVGCLEAELREGGGGPGSQGARQDGDGACYFHSGSSTRWLPSSQLCVRARPCALRWSMGSMSSRPCTGQAAPGEARGVRPFDALFRVSL